MALQDKMLLALAPRPHPTKSRCTSGECAAVLKKIHFLVLGAQHWHASEVWTNWHPQGRTQNWDSVVLPLTRPLAHVPDLRDIRG